SKGGDGNGKGWAWPIGARFRHGNSATDAIGVRGRLRVSGGGSDFYKLRKRVRPQAVFRRAGNLGRQHNITCLLDRRLQSLIVRRIFFFRQENVDADYLRTLPADGPNHLRYALSWPGPPAILGQGRIVDHNQGHVFRSWLDTANAKI